MRPVIPAEVRRYHRRRLSPGESGSSCSTSRREFIAGSAALHLPIFGDWNPFDAFLKDRRGMHQKPPAAIRLSNQGAMPSLSGATQWLNSAPLTSGELRGKVVLVEFWTYTCINWLRAHPYVRAWLGKYQDHGLIVIGVHAPEFTFERDIENVRRAVRDLKVEYPVVMDNDFAIWRAFDNFAWPAFYFIDAQMQIRHHQFGEGEYGHAERVIQQLLADAGMASDGLDLVSVDARGVEAPADWTNLRSSESYTGYERAENFASPGGAAFNRRRDYAMPMRLMLNQWALSGHWTMEKEALVLNESGGRIAYRFHSRDLHLVMGSSAVDQRIRFRVKIDNAPPGRDHGADIDSDGWGTLREPRLYQLLRQSAEIRDRTFEISFEDAGARTYAFTFG